MSLISPRTGLNFVKAGLKSTLGQEIEDFDILYFHSPQKIDVRIYNFVDAIGHTHEKKVFKYDESEKLFGIINAMLKKELKPGHAIVKALISYSQMIVILTSTKDDVPETKTIKL